MLRGAQQEVVRSLIDEIQNGLQAEIGHLLVDIQNVVCEEGEVSESRRYPETARNMQRLVDDLAEELVGRHHLLLQLRERQ
jgi:hypothetical protein